MKVRIHLWEWCHPYVEWWWRIDGRGWHTNCDREVGYTTRQGALRAARRLCRRMNLTIVQED